MPVGSDDEHTDAAGTSSENDWDDERPSPVEENPGEPDPSSEASNGKPGPPIEVTESSGPGGQPAAGDEQPGATDDEAEQAAGGSEEWRFSLDEVGDEETGDERSGNVTGTIRARGPLEPGDIDLENAVFFLVGALGTILFVVLAVAGL